ncbi:MAG: tRNA (adenosine(37)-N6)-threonylcarbamoyltransferase complex ATPase subunit type 1 TsaE [Dehalobacterium sp.]
MLLTVKTKDPEETFSLGERLASYLPPGTVIALTGELGAGKTLLAKGIANGLKVTDQVTSPTFTIINEYQGIVPLFHIDAYRLEEDSGIEELGLEEYFNSSGVTLIEWPERIKNYLPASYLRIDIEKGLDQSGREYRILSFSSVGNGRDNVIGAFENNENIRN